MANQGTVLGGVDLSCLGHRGHGDVVQLSDPCYFERPVSHGRREGLNERPVSHERSKGLEEDTELELTPDEDGVELSGKACPPPGLVGLGRIHKAGVVGFLVEGRPISRH